jgi:hypothetical protein
MPIYNRQQDMFAIFNREPTPIERAEDGSAAAAVARWSADEQAQVDAAIRRCAVELDEFTSDDVWRRIPEVRITKGIGARLMAASRAGLIVSTGTTTIARRGGEHDHAQRLGVWRSRLRLRARP